MGDLGGPPPRQWVLGVWLEGLDQLPDGCVPLATCSQGCVWGVWVKASAALRFSVSRRGLLRGSAELLVQTPAAEWVKGETTGASRAVMHRVVVQHVGEFPTHPGFPLALGLVAVSARLRSD